MVSKSKGKRIASSILATIVALSIPLQAKAISNNTINAWTQVEENVKEMPNDSSEEDHNKLKILINNAISQLKKDVDVDIAQGNFDNCLSALDKIILSIMVQIRKDFNGYETQLDDLIKLRNKVTDAKTKISASLDYKKEEREYVKKHLESDIKKIKILANLIKSKGRAGDMGYVYESKVSYKNWKIIRITLTNRGINTRGSGFNMLQITIIDNVGNTLYTISEQSFKGFLKTD